MESVHLKGDLELDDIRLTLHHMRLKPRVTMEALACFAALSSQYLCGTNKLDSQHVICNVNVRSRHGYWKTVRALIDCRATSVFVSLYLVERLELLTIPAYTTTRGIDGKMLADARNSQK